MKALTPCAVAAALLEVVAGAEDEVLEEADEVGVVPVPVLEAEPALEPAPVPEAVAEEVKVTPTARHEVSPAWRAAARSAP